MTEQLPYGPGSGDWEPGVSAPVSSRVSTVVSPDVSGGVAWDVSEAGPDGDGNEPLRVGDWEPAPDEDEAAPARTVRLRPVLENAARSELFGGGPNGILSALANPMPETLKQHAAHVNAHPFRPEGKAKIAAFTAAHWIATGPPKLTGKSMCAVGAWLIFAGRRLDMIGDRAARVGFAVFFLALAALVLYILASAL